MAATTISPSRLASSRAWLRTHLVGDLWGTVIAATCLGSLVRLTFVLSVDFPVNDGGLFYAMVRDIQESSYRLPETTSYNNAGIPFAYPPLPFYATAAINDLTGISLFTLFRVLPLIGSVLTIPAFFLVSRNLLRSNFAIEVSVLVFALIPRVFDWQISGGGVTRSYGLLFALLAMHQAIRLLIKGREGAWPFVGVFAALCVLCHPEMGLYFAYSYAVFLVHAGITRARLVLSAKATALAGVLSAPWWLWVLVEHGLGPLTNASASGASAALLAIRIIDPSVLDEPLFPFVLALGFAGAIVCVRQRWFLLPAWVLVLFVFEPRKAPTDASVPLAMLAGIAVAEALLPALASSGAIVRPRARRSVFYGLAILLSLSALLSPAARVSPLGSVSEDGRETMAWVDSSAPVAAKFAIITGKDWALDSFSEWFPAVTGRRSLATAQGYEWLGGGRFVDQQEFHRELQLCGDLDAACLEEWEDDFGEEFTHVLIATDETFAIVPGPDGGCCEGLRRSLSKDPRYIEVDAGPGGTVFERRR